MSRAPGRSRNLLLAVALCLTILLAGCGAAPTQTAATSEKSGPAGEPTEPETKEETTVKTAFCLLLCAALLLPASGAFAAVSGRQAADYSPALYQLAEEHGFRIGICLSPNQLKDSNYLNFLTTQFNSTTCTNEMKAYSLLDQMASKNSPDGMPRMNWSTPCSRVRPADRSAGL